MDINVLSNAINRFADKIVEFPIRRHVVSRVSS